MVTTAGTTAEVTTTNAAFDSQDPGGRPEEGVAAARTRTLYEQHHQTVSVICRALLRDLSEAEWQWALDFVTTGGETLSAYPEYARVHVEDGVYMLGPGEQARRHRMSIGTIVSDAQIVVQYLRGGVLGSVEESFAARLTLVPANPDRDLATVGLTVERISLEMA